ncbi:unnamed protein product [Paramecium pentaurelia]|uniref:Micro-fibrillar-associated protein 1 C-terminal domain-containing protein n=1 Tax=Paramecium pentaurelia TaxID=43138 RepID=A0A8S1XDR2_9CILI|nr:unnamed protein product [Paramecium pentaurelia]
MQEYNFQVYQKPKNEFDVSYEDQVKQKKQRLWTGKPVPQQQDDQDDDIFDQPKKDEKVEITKVEQEIQRNPQEIVQTFQKVENDNYQIEVVDEEAAMMRRRRVIQSRLAEEQQLLQQEQQQNQEQKKEKKQKERKKEKKHKKKKDDIIYKNDQDEQEEDNQEQQKEIELLKPVFVSRVQRDQLDKIEEEEIRLKEEKTKNLERMRLENKILILNSVKSDAAKAVNEDSDDGQQKLNDEDTLDETEYALWKIRELKRIKQFNDEKNKYEIERVEIERRRNLTDMQRIQEDFKLGSDKTKMEDKTKYVFMQKYYNTGAFYKDMDDPIFQRDYNLPVGEDLWRKDNLPQILQKRRGEFGKKGNSKYTHLTQEDTTNFDPSYQVDQNIRQKFLNQQAGSKSSNNFFNQFKKS